MGKFTLVVCFTSGSQFRQYYDKAAQVELIEDKGILRLDTTEQSCFFVLANVTSWTLNTNEVDDA